MHHTLRKQEAWYNQHARLRTFAPGEKVLLLLASTASIFLARWQGLYPILEQVSDVTYAVDMIGHQNRRRVFHVNMLEQWK